MEMTIKCTKELYTTSLFVCIIKKDQSTIKVNHTNLLYKWSSFTRYLFLSLIYNRKQPQIWIKFDSMIHHTHENIKRLKHVILRPYYNFGTPTIPHFILLFIVIFFQKLPSQKALDGIVKRLPMKYKRMFLGLLIVYSHCVYTNIQHALCRKLISFVS